MKGRSLLVWWVLVAAACYRLEIGGRELLPEGFSEEEGAGSSGCRSHMLLFPYSVYQCVRSATQAVRFVFLKLPYAVVQPSLSLQPRSVVSVDEFQVLWAKLPTVLAVEGGAEEVVEVMGASRGLETRHFMVRNASRSGGRAQLHFYSLRLHAFLHAALRTASKEVDKQLKAGVLSEAAFSNPLEQEGADAAERSRWAYMLQRVFPREEYFSYPELWSSLVQKEMVREVGQGKWWVMEEAFKSVFLAATVTQQAQLQLELVVLFTAETETRRSQVVRQPLSGLGLGSLETLQSCREGEQLKVLLADHRSYFLFDFTLPEWHLDVYRTYNSSLHAVYAMEGCRVAVLQDTPEGAELTLWQGAVQKASYLQRGERVASSQLVSPSLLAVRFENSSWELVGVGMERRETGVAGSVRWEQRVEVGENLTRYLQGVEEGKVVGRSVEESEAVVAGNSSLLWEAVYNLRTYLNKSELKNSEINRIVWQHLSAAQPLTFQEFENLVDGQNADCFQAHSSTTLTNFTLQPGNWSLCSLRTTTEASSQLSVYGQAQLISCWASVESFSGQAGAGCEAVGVGTGGVVGLKANHFYKVFALWPEQGLGLGVRDLEKEQLELASTLFFVIMLALSLTLFLLILVIVLRPVVRGLLVYYGWQQQRGDFAYPLSWFNLKIKLKRLADLGYLRYLPHRQPLPDDETHCCFCLEVVQEGRTAAQLFCLHQFHPECFHEWIRNEANPRCPTCRREFNRTNLQDLQRSQQEIPLQED